MECEYAKEIKNGYSLYVECKVGGGVCGYLRYCNAERCYKNAPSYVDCKFRTTQKEKESIK